MIPIYRQSVIHLEITNFCNLKCNNCSRFCNINHSNKYFMSILEIKEAIRSLKGFKQQIGIMGGEPTMHPEFRRICFELTAIPIEQRSLWTNGFKYDEYRDVIENTFLPENIIYNNHEDDSDIDIHQPLHYKSSELIKDPFLRGLLIGNCWMQWRWGASITPKGGYFCEVAAAMDMRDNGNNGYTIKPEWWNKDPNEFIDQVKHFCPNCSACVPMSGDLAKGGVDPHDNITEQDIFKTIKNGWYPYDHRKVLKDGNDII